VTGNNNNEKFNFGSNFEISMKLDRWLTIWKYTFARYHPTNKQYQFWSNRVAARSLFSHLLKSKEKTKTNGLLFIY